MHILVSYLTCTCSQSNPYFQLSGYQDNTIYFVSTVHMVANYPFAISTYVHAAQLWRYRGINYAYKSAYTLSNVHD